MSLRVDVGGLLGGGWLWDALDQAYRTRLVPTLRNSLQNPKSALKLGDDRPMRAQLHFVSEVKSRDFHVIGESHGDETEQPPDDE